jgi:hypothetical protein
MQVQQDVFYKLWAAVLQANKQKQVVGNNCTTLSAVSSQSDCDSQQQQLQAALLSSRAAYSCSMLRSHR